MTSVTAGAHVSGLESAMSTRLLGGSLVSWVTLSITVIGLGINFGYSHASLRADNESNRWLIQRNREEANDRIKAIEGNIGNIFGSLSAIHSIKTDVEVIKAQIQSVNEAIKRIERQGTRATQR